MNQIFKSEIIIINEYKNTFLCSVEKWKSVNKIEEKKIDNKQASKKKISKTSNLNEVMSSQVQIDDVKKF